MAKRHNLKLRGVVLVDSATETGVEHRVTFVDNVEGYAEMYEVRRVKSFARDPKLGWHRIQDAAPYRPTRSREVVRRG